MREIKIRGYAVEEMVNSQWIYGTGVHTTEFTKEFAEEAGKSGETFVFTENGGWIEVHPESVGQYTDLKDKNNKEIFEGDIINYSFTDCGEVNTRVLEVYNDGTNFKTREIYRDYWLEKVGGVLSIVHGQLNAHKGKTQYLTDISCSSIYSYKVIGNIYENPELLEVTA